MSLLDARTAQAFPMTETELKLIAAAAMSVRSARKWQRGSLPSETKTPRTWRTREDPFAEIWDREIVKLLTDDAKGVLQATTVLSWVQDKHPDEYDDGLLRTLQRRIRDWRALHGPPKEVFFEQEHVPGREAAFDFTDCGELGVTIGGKPFEHLLFEFVLSYSSWTWVDLAFGETYEAMSAGIQGAIWDLRGVPHVLRSDNLSAATHDLKRAGRVLTERYKALIEQSSPKSGRRCDHCPRRRCRRTRCSIRACASGAPSASDTRPTRCHRG